VVIIVSASRGIGMELVMPPVLLRENGRPPRASVPGYAPCREASAVRAGSPPAKEKARRGLAFSRALR
jgi:hypothetical protein